MDLLETTVSRVELLLALFPVSTK